MNLTEQQKNDPKIQAGLAQSVGQLCFMEYNSLYEYMKKALGGLPLANEKKELLGIMVLTAVWDAGRKHATSSQKLASTMHNVIIGYVNYSAAAYGWPDVIKQPIIEDLQEKAQSSVSIVTQHERVDTSDFADFMSAFETLTDGNLLAEMFLFKAYGLFKKAVLEFMDTIQLQR